MVSGNRAFSYLSEHIEIRTEEEFNTDDRSTRSGVPTPEGSFPQSLDQPVDPVGRSLQFFPPIRSRMAEIDIIAQGDHLIDVIEGLAGPIHLLEERG